MYTQIRREMRAHDDLEHVSEKPHTQLKAGSSVLGQGPEDIG